jgi:topoisomerase-4 subunit A
MREEQQDLFSASNVRNNARKPGVIPPREPMPEQETAKEPEAAITPEIVEAPVVTETDQTPIAEPVIDEPAPVAAEPENETEEPAAETEPADDNDDDDNGEPPAKNHLPVHERHGPLTDLIDFNFLQYASYVICERAIPNVEDGLKPVQRRIMHSLKEKDDGRFIKVANVVGHTMQYHPHGDASIADALVALANKRYLIEGQGNYGNVFTGDPAAASRYIECRLTELARNELFNKELTKWIPSYDGRNKEPVTLPCKLPMMLMLGAEGIAVGLSTRILPHNFIELLEKQIDILREKKNTPIEFNLLPDFQTGGLMDVSEYNKGNGKIKLRAKIEPKGKNQLVITELPAGQTTESLTSSIEDAVKKKKVPVRAIDDYTAEKVEIDLTLTQGYDQEKAIKALFAFTNCETSITSRIIAIHDKRPVELDVEDILRANTAQLLDILERELLLQKDKLLDEFHSKTLVQIFVENRIYKRIEECKTYEEVIQAVFDGLAPFAHRLKREIIKDDIEMLLSIRIKRISRFDIDKNTKDIEAILEELEEVEKNLGTLKAYAIRYLKRLIKQYASEYPRCTQTAEFQAVSLRTLTANELTISIDREKGYIGSSVKGEELFQCSSLDKLLIMKNDGTYQVVAPPETLYIDTNLAWCGVYDRELEFSVAYTDKKVTYIKRFKIGGVIMDRDYEFAPPKSSLLLFLENAPESIYIKYKPIKNQRIVQQQFNMAEVLVKNVKAKGKQMTAKPIQYIAAEPGRWWNKNDDSPDGVLM